MSVRKMALFPCRECGAMISSRAPRCPSCGGPVVAPASERAKDLILVLVIIAIVGASCWAVIDLTIGSAEAARLFATTFHRPMDLKDEKVSVPSDEFRGVLVDVPYSGSVTLEVRSLGGQRIDAHLIKGADLIRLANAKPPFTTLKLNDFGAFEASAAPAAVQNGHLSAGRYLVVLEHANRGAPASDARVLMRLAP
jgi:hypothetical protein